MSTDLDRKLSHIHALVKYLCDVPDKRAGDIIIQVQPIDPGMWRVQVSHMGFMLGEAADKLSVATDLVLERLTSTVSKRLEEGSRLIGKPDDV